MKGKLEKLFVLLFVFILDVFLCIEFIYPLIGGYCEIKAGNPNGIYPKKIQNYTYDQLPAKLNNFQTDSYVNMDFANNVVLFHSQYDAVPNVFSDFPLNLFTPLVDFPTRFDTYFVEHMPYKAQYMKSVTDFRFYLLKESVNREVLVGKKQWLFYAPNLVQYIEKPTDEVDMEISAKNIKEYQSIVQENHGEFVVLITPNKMSVYEEYLPTEYSGRNSHNTQRLIDYLNKNTDAKIVFPLETLIKQHDIYQLYYKLDTHWNQLGAYIGYCELEKALGQCCPTLEEKKIIKIPYNHGDLARFIGFNHDELQDICYVLDNKREKYQGVLAEENGFDYLRFTNKNGNGKKILMFRDSFATGMIPYLANDYSECVFYWKDFDENIVEKEQADIVIYQIVERSIDKLSQ